MRRHPIRQSLLAIIIASLVSGSAFAADEAKPDKPAAPTMASVMDTAKDSDWRDLDPDNTLYMDLPGGRVVIELAPQFAPLGVDNIRTLVKEGYFDGLAIIRSQDNYVVQWGDPNADNAADSENPPKSIGKAKEKVAGEYFRKAEGLPFTALPDPDSYAPQTGFSGGFPVGRDGADGRAWLTHCYGMVGVARGMEPDSGNGAQLYVIIGHAPRHLDRNVTLVGEVWSGMELLSTMPRGKGQLGFYEDPSRRTSIASIKLASDVPEDQRQPIQIMKTDSDTFKQLIQARRHRAEDWFLDPADHLSVCNMIIPSRLKPVETPAE